LERWRKRVAELEKRLTTGRDGEREAPLFVFESLRERVPTGPRKITLRRDDSFVTFWLFLPDSVKSHWYRASMMHDDDTVWLVSRLEAHGRRRRFVEARIPIQALAQDRYVLSLEAKVADAYEKIDAYLIDIRMR